MAAYTLDKQMQAEEQQLTYLKKMRSGFEESKKQSPAGPIIIVLACIPVLLSNQIETSVRSLLGSKDASMITQVKQTTASSKHKLRLVKTATQTRHR